MTWGQGRHVSPRVKTQVRRRDRTCQLSYPGCTTTIDELHHPQGLADTAQPRTSILTAAQVVGVCHWCHNIETRAQQARGRQRARAQRGTVHRRNRDHEPHPGRLT